MKKFFSKIFGKEVKETNELILQKVELKNFNDPCSYRKNPNFKARNLLGLLNINKESLFAFANENVKTIIIDIDNKLGAVDNLSLNNIKFYKVGEINIEKWIKTKDNTTILITTINDLESVSNELFNHVIMSNKIPLSEVGEVSETTYFNFYSLIRIAMPEDTSFINKSPNFLKIFDFGRSHNIQFFEISENPDMHTNYHFFLTDTNNFRFEIDFESFAKWFFIALIAFLIFNSIKNY